MSEADDRALLLSRAARTLAALSSPDRLIILATVLRATYSMRTIAVADLAAQSRQGLEQTARAVATLAEAGLLTLRGDQVDYAGGGLAEMAEALVATMPVMGWLADEPELRRYFRHGRLTRLPAPNRVDERRRLAGVVVRLFEDQRSYAEPEVNAALCTVMDDYAALRRFLVEEGRLDRRAGRDYRRTRVTPPAGSAG